jgi:hypothetical protein
MNRDRHPRFGRWLATAGLLIGTSLASSGCVNASTGPAVVTPGSEPAPDQPEGLADGDSADELDARKDKLVQSMRDLRGAASSDPKQCEDLCSLATSICGVSEKLCNIADDHAGNDHYQDLCREAKRECREAQADCVACVEGLADDGATGTCGGAPTEPASTEPKAEAAESEADAPGPRTSE